jgi:hypothetical protein
MRPALDLARLHAKQFYTSFMNILSSASSLYIYIYIYIYIKDMQLEVSSLFSYSWIAGLKN